MLTATSISFTYPRRQRPAPPVLEGVSLDVARGTIVGLLGPNGSGKTTLLRLLAGMLTPDTGAVAIDGRSLATWNRRELAQRIAVVPQDTHTTFDFSVLDTVLMGRYPHLGPFQLEGPDDMRTAQEAMAATATAPLAERLFSTLSGGERQRVVIASALAQGSDMILLDEPTASLDLKYQLGIAALLKELNATRGTTLVVSTHDLNLAAGLCQEIVLLEQGHVIAKGTPAETLTAANLRALYRVETEVSFHERAGHLTVIPVGPAEPAQ